jgi:hemoglobin
MSKFTRAEIKDMTGTSALHPHQRLHARSHLSPAHFDRWLALWCAAVDDRYAGPTAELAKLQATRVAGAMSRPITGQEPAPGAATLAPADQP